MVLAQSSRAATAPGEAMPTSNASKPLPRAPVNASTGRSCVPGANPGASSSAPGSHALAGS
eukprot:11214460-Lingulodinium_polyedra.AAC.1